MLKKNYLKIGVMDIKKEFVKALFDSNIRSSASKMFQADFEYNGHKNRMPIELFDINFRLHKPTPKYVNLEFLATSRSGRYFQPVGFYEQDKSIWLLNDFSDAYHSLSVSGQVSDSPKFCEIKTSAVIAAFSVLAFEMAVEVLNDFKQNGWKPKFTNGVMIPATERYDRHFECNGLKCELVFCSEGYPQFYLDDSYKLRGPIAAYFLDRTGRINVNPTVDYKGLFDSLDSRQLLTVFTRI